MEEIKALKALAIHETLKMSEQLSILRVPGGVIYIFSKENIGPGAASTTVHTQYVKFGEMIAQEQRINEL